MQHRGGVADRADHAHRMRDHDRPAVQQPVAEISLALLTEIAVSNARHLVDQIGVEMDPHRDAEGEA
ncbi:hypothetical protein D3C76_1812970 [compost metagenome]